MIASGCCLVGPPQQSTSPVERTTLEETSIRPARGAIVIAHGLNQRPSSMDFLAQFLRSEGYHTLRVALAGHDTPQAYAFPSSIWVQQIVTSFHETKDRYPALPILYLGYSMSGLAAVRALDTDPSFSPQRMVLIAPALSLRSIVESASILRWFPPTTFAVRNLAPRAYRRYERTPLFWYQNVAEMYQQTATLENGQRAGATPTLIFANPRDELVSLTGLQSWIADNNLSDRWKLSIVRPETPDPTLAEHLLIDPRGLGIETWRTMEREIRDFIRNQDGVADPTQPRFRQGYTLAPSREGSYS
jgi:alpha-beta hydrolase superfamily lysophospholipase